VEGVGPVIAEQVAEWSSDPDNVALIERLAKAGVRMESEQSATASAVPGPLEGVSLVVSGTLEGLTRDEAQAAIEAAGGKATGSVSGRTTALVVGESPGASKVDRANDLGIPIIDEATFKKLLDEGPSVLG
jgi:DNA ligase (NAD+)